MCSDNMNSVAHNTYAMRPVRKDVGMRELLPVRNGTLLNHFFTQSVWSSLLNEGSHRRLDAILKRYAEGRIDYRSMSNKEVVDWLYSFLSDNWRNEYFVKNELLRHYLVEQKPSKDAVALTQLPIGLSRADFVVVNGDGVVYEIKTDRDSFERLESQLKDYYKVFSKVYVVVGDVLLEEAKQRLSKSKTGILHLGKDNHLTKIKAAIPDKRSFDALTMLRMFRRDELDDTMVKCLGHLPQVGSMFYHRVAHESLLNVSVDKLHHHLMRCLKQRMKTACLPKVSGLLALGYFWPKSDDFSRMIESFGKKRYRRKQASGSGRKGKDVTKVLSLFSGASV